MELGIIAIGVTFILLVGCIPLVAVWVFIVSPNGDKLVDKYLFLAAHRWERDLIEIRDGVYGAQQTSDEDKRRAKEVIELIHQARAENSRDLMVAALGQYSHLAVSINRNL